MDLKEPGNHLLLVGATRDEMGGSHYHLVTGRPGGRVPMPDLTLAPQVFAKLHDVLRRGLVRACHDLSEGGLAVALAEMAFAGDVGADVTGLGTLGQLPDEVLLFSESATRFVMEVASANVAAVREGFGSVLLFDLGRTVKEPRLRIAGANGEWLVWAQLADLKEAWQKPLRY
jgi:phosphoribosylformylglycinamidine synthase